MDVTVRMKKSYHQKVKELSAKKDNGIGKMYEEIIDFYLYHKENELDHKLEYFLNRKFEKIDEHLSSIIIKNAMDTCSVFMTARDTLYVLNKMLKLQTGEYDEEEESKISFKDYEREYERLGLKYFDRRWRNKK